MKQQLSFFAKKNNTKLLNFAYKLCANRELSSDLVQEAYCKVIEDYRTIKYNNKFIFSNGFDEDELLKFMFLLLACVLEVF